MPAPEPPRPTYIARRPLIGLALAFTAGTTAGLYRAWDPVAAIIITGGLLILALLRIQARRSTGYLYGAVVGVALLAADLVAHDPSPAHLAAICPAPREFVGLAGVIANDPFAEHLGHGRTRWAFELRVEGVRRMPWWQRAHGRVRLEIDTWRTDQPWRYGDRWLWAGFLEHRRNAGWHEPGALVLRGTDTDAQWLARGQGSRLVRWCLDRRRECAGLLRQGIAGYPQVDQVLQAIMLGYGQALSTDLRAIFATTGTLHIFAISGLHVVLFGALVIAVLAAAGINRTRWSLYLIPILVVYIIATGAAASAVRAGVMAGLFWGAPLARRKPDGPSALAAAAIVILAFAPGQLASRGFIFSFVAVAGLMLFYPVLQPWFTLRTQRDPWQIQADTGWWRWGRVLLVKVGELLAMSLAAWLVSAPITAYWFNLFSPVGLVDNLFVVPGSSLVVVTGILSLVFGALHPLLAEVFNHANRVFITVLIEAVEWSRRLPGSYWYLCTPAPWVMVLWYAAALLLVIRWRWYRRIVGTLAVLAVVFLAWRHVTDRQVQVDVLDVGQGNSAFINLPGSADVLVDTGAPFYADRILRHLRRQGVDRLQAIVLTHPASAHAGAAAALLAALPVNELWIPPFDGRADHYRAALDLARSQGITVRRLAAGDTGTWPGHVEWEVFYPPRDARYQPAYAGSLVLRVAREGAAVLLMGGAGAPVERALLRQPCEPAAPVLVAGDHGHAGTCETPWLDLVAPRDVILSVGQYNRMGDPAPGVLRRLAAAGLATWRTDEQGPIRITWPGRPPRPNDPPAYAVQAINPR